MLEWASSIDIKRLKLDLLRYGAVLLRDFRAIDPSEFQHLLELLFGSLVDYSFRSTPRALVSGKVYTSTEYPHSEAIQQHNEMSYTKCWPLKIAFLCVQQPQHGGQTPISDSRNVYRAIPDSVRERFLEHGVLYVRNYLPGVDLSWREVFQTEDRRDVERYCSEHDIECSWNGERLTTRQVCQAVAQHPETHDIVWFNQAHMFHVSSLTAAMQDILLREFGERCLPRNAYYGNGEAIDPIDLDVVRTTLNNHTVVFHWKEGDVLLLDNMLTAHGRQPFVGARKVVVAMAMPVYATNDEAQYHSRKPNG